MTFREFPAHFFRLFICHDDKQLPLARELRTQLGEYGIASFVAREQTDRAHARQQRARVQAALAEMDGLVALVTHRFESDPWCNQELGFALGKGVHLQSIALTTATAESALGLPQLLMPTDFDLPSLVSRGVARDPLVSERLCRPAIETVLTRRGEALEKGLRLLECIAWPGEDSVIQLVRARERLSGSLPPVALRRLDRLIERWHEMTEDPRSDGHTSFRPQRRAGTPKRRALVPLLGPL